MATVVNYRDVALQATSPRMLGVDLPDNISVPALRGINLSAPAYSFRVSNSGVATPSSLAITAELKEITGTTSWSVVAGVATLTGTGDTRTLAYADMGSDFVTVQAQVTFGATVYIAQVSLYKIHDGDRGTTGTLDGYGAAYGMVASSWSDGLANRVIYNMLTGESSTATMTQTTHLLRGDKVTLSNGSTYAETRFWDGVSWIAPGMVIDGNLIVNGTVAADKVTAGSIQTGFAANARIRIGDISFIGGITSPMHVEKVSARANQALITAKNDKDDSVAIWGSSVYPGGNAVSGTWHSNATEATAGRWQLIGILGSKLFGAGVAGNVYDSAGDFGGWFRYFSTPSDSGAPVLLAEAKLASGAGGITRAAIFTGKVQLAGTGSSIILNSSEGTAGQVLTSQGLGATPTWTTIAPGSVTYSGIQTAMGGTTGSALDLTTTFRATGTNAPQGGTGVELAYLAPNGFLIAGTRSVSGTISSYSPLQIQAASVDFNCLATASTASTSTNNTTLATTAYTVSRIAQDAPTKTGGGASGTWGISVSGQSTSVNGYKCFGGAATTDGSGNATITFPSSFSSASSYGVSANGTNGINVVITAASATSVTFQTQNASTGAAVSSSALRWTAVGT